MNFSVAIIDPDDPRVADYRAVSEPALALERGLFVAEGRFVVERLIATRRFNIRSVLLNAASFEALKAPLSLLPPATLVYVANQALFERIAGFNIHRGCLALAERPTEPSLDRLAGNARMLIVSEDCANADNIGGMFRNAAAFAADGVILSPGCCDPLYRKAIRTSMAAALQVPFFRTAAWPSVLGDLKSRGFSIVALTPRRPSLTLDEFARRSSGDRMALLLGAEGAGLTEQALAFADVRVRIPIAETVDSLNLAVASGIVLSRLGMSTVSDKT